MENLTDILLSQATLQNPYKYASIIKATRSDIVSDLKLRLEFLKEALVSAEKSQKNAAEFRRHVTGEDFARRRKKTKTAFDSLESQNDNIYRQVDVSVLLTEHYQYLMELYRAAVQGVELISNANIITFDKAMDNAIKGLGDAEGELGVDRTSALIEKLRETQGDMLKNLAAEQQLNTGATMAFMQGLYLLGTVSAKYVKMLRNMSVLYEQYYERLRHRHNVEGIEIVSLGGKPSVTLTDIAIMVWENIDRVGEIDDGSTEDELSAYTLHRANSMLMAAKRPDVWSWMLNPGKESMLWAEQLLAMVKALHQSAITMKGMIGESSWDLTMIDVEGEFAKFKDVIESLDLSQITHKIPERALSKTERFAVNHRNKSITKVANLLVYGEGSLTEMVDELLKLKIEEHKFFVHENSFYVCKIGTGNMFTGEAPGQLTVIPGEKPHADLRHIWGKGFDEVRDFVDGMEDAEKWNRLFLVTSPSQSTDKNNVLLVGPQGCGKTEVMRGMATETDSVAIFVVGSDFLTCWMGEAQKNPKRLFEQAIRLRHSSGLPVHIMIDEIDTVLNDDHSAGSRINLSLEFQNLMDGVVAYPGITIWGATNHPERIPTPMLRRFARVLIVGELSAEQRRQTLEHYLTHFLPCQEFSEEQWDAWVEELDGATGDILRKIIDEVWKNLIRTFVVEHKDAAEEVIAFIQSSYGDNFDISDLEDEDRQKIKSMIGACISVSAEMVDSGIAHLLDNFAIQQQILDAKNTYKNAEKLVNRQRNACKSRGIGFD